MDFPSCPQEILASVLKYITFETVTRIRKTNKHMDYVATKYRINLPKVERVQLVCYGQVDVELYLEYAKGCIWDKYSNILRCQEILRKYKVILPDDQYDIIIVLAEIVKKIRSTRLMGLHDGEIDTNIIGFLQSLKFTKKIILFINDCNISVSLEDLTSVLARFPHSEVKIYPGNTMMNESMGTDVITIALLPYTDIKFDDQWLRATPRHPAITDETLRAARQYLPNEFQVVWDCTFSVAEIKKTMLYLIECFERRNKKAISWYSGHLQLKSVEELNRTVKELSTIPGTIVKQNRKKFASISYKVEKQQNLFWKHHDILFNCTTY